jgi:hypothetical protein
MKKFRVVFYKAKFWDGHKIDNLIDIWTMLVNLPYVTCKSKLNFKEVWKFIKEFNYSHVEKWEPYGTFHKPRTCDWWNGIMATSTMRDEDDGTVVRPVREVIRDVDRWDAAEFEVHSLSYMQAHEWEEHELYNNLGYAVKDIGKFFPVVRKFVGDPNRNICSEFVHNFMACCGFFPKFRVLSPRLLAWLIYKELGKEFKPVREM